MKYIHEGFMPAAYILNKCKWIKNEIALKNMWKGGAIRGQYPTKQNGMKFLFHFQDILDLYEAKRRTDGRYHGIDGEVIYPYITYDKKMHDNFAYQLTGVSWDTIADVLRLPDEKRNQIKHMYGGEYIKVEIEGQNTKRRGGMIKGGV